MSITRVHDEIGINIPTHYFTCTIGSKLTSATPEYVMEVMRSAVKQYVAGLIVPPQIVEMTEFSTAVRPGGSVLDKDRAPNKLFFRATFQAEIPKLGRQFFLVLVQCYSEPDNGEINRLSSMGPAEFYVWNEGKWAHNFDFMHADCIKDTDHADDGEPFPEPFDQVLDPLIHGVIKSMK